MVNKIVREKLTADIGTKLSKEEVDLNIKLAYEAVEHLYKGKTTKVIKCDFGTVDVNQVASGKWVSDGNLLP